MADPPQARADWLTDHNLGQWLPDQIGGDFESFSVRYVRAGKYLVEYVNQIEYLKLILFKNIHIVGGSKLEQSPPLSNILFMLVYLLQNGTSVLKNGNDRSLTSCRGVIRCQELVDIDESENQSELASQCVSHVKHICLNKGQKKTNTYILTFSLTKIPATIKIGYINAKVSLCIPNPLRSFRCQRFGHGQSSYIRTPRCVNCTGYHVSKHHTEPSRCANCPGGAFHKASDRNCPMYLKEKEILRIEYTETISFPEARARVDHTQPQSTSASYSQILQG